MDTLSMLSKFFFVFFGALSAAAGSGSIRLGGRGGGFGLDDVFVSVHHHLRRSLGFLLENLRLRLGLRLLLRAQPVLLELAVGDLFFDELLLLLEELELARDLFLARRREVALLGDGHDDFFRKRRECLLDLLERHRLALLRGELVEVHGGIPRDVPGAHRRGLLSFRGGLNPLLGDRKRPG
jgi:hypothetical protein